MRIKTGYTVTFLRTVLMTFAVDTDKRLAA